ncbi:hypothetical protein SAMN05880557_11781 [Pseudacidovorax sp. RU35E]|nr:hypothetical protein SAMN05880557_11781 [Pseudacidovorax sp. RU35E]
MRLAAGDESGVVRPAAGPQPFKAQCPHGVVAHVQFEEDFRCDVVLAVKVGERHPQNRGDRSRRGQRRFVHAGFVARNSGAAARLVQPDENAQSVLRQSRSKTRFAHASTEYGAGRGRTVERHPTIFEVFGLKCSTKYVDNGRRGFALGACERTLPCNKLLPCPRRNPCASPSGCLQGCERRSAAWMDPWSYGLGCMSVLIASGWACRFQHSRGSPAYPCPCFRVLSGAWYLLQRRR